jgi:hypothetical protein
MRYVTLQHADGHAVTVFVEHVVAVMTGTYSSQACAFIYFASGFSIPVIERREDILKAIGYSHLTAL